MSDYGASIVWVAILVALVPAFALFVYFARAKKSMWLGFVIGAVGWMVALLLRLPILEGISGFLREAFASALLPYIGVMISSLFAGLFEEGVRYGFMKRIQITRGDLRHVLSFGLGWGFGEALLIYALAIATVSLQGQSLPLTSLFLGALERNITIALHVGLTFVIFQAVTDVRFLLVAIGTHFAVDFVGVSLFVLTGNVWTTYSVALVIALILVGYAYRLTKAKTQERGEYNTRTPQSLQSS